MYGPPEKKRALQQGPVLEVLSLSEPLVVRLPTANATIRKIEGDERINWSTDNFCVKDQCDLTRSPIMNQKIFSSMTPMNWSDVGSGALSVGETLAMTTTVPQVHCGNYQFTTHCNNTCLLTTNVAVVSPPRVHHEQFHTGCQNLRRHLSLLAAVNRAAVAVAFGSWAVRAQVMATNSRRYQLLPLRVHVS